MWQGLAGRTSLKMVGFLEVEAALPPQVRDLAVNQQPRIVVRQERRAVWGVEFRV